MFSAYAGHRQNWPVRNLTGKQSYIYKTAVQVFVLEWWWVALIGVIGAAAGGDTLLLVNAGNVAGTVDPVEVFTAS